MLEQVGGRCVPDRKAMIDVIAGAGIEALYGGIDCAELARRSRRCFSGGAIVNAYIQLYQARCGSTVPAG